MNRQEMLEALDKRVAEIKTEIESYPPDTQYAFAFGLVSLEAPEKDSPEKMIASYSGALGDMDPLLCASGCSAATAAAATTSVSPLFYLSRLNAAVLSFLKQGGNGAVIRKEDIKNVSDIFKNNGPSPSGTRH